MNTSIIHSANGNQLFFEKQVLAKNQAKVLLIHGYAEHSGRYSAFLDQLSNSGYDTYRYDHQGFGKSAGKSGYISSFQNYVDDLEIVINSLPADGKPLFVFSHSMGGLVLTNYLIDKKPNNIKGVVFSAPALMVPADMSPFLQKISGLLSTILPFVKTVKLDMKALSRDQDEVDKYINDPLVYHKGIVARTGAEILKTQEWIQGQFANITIPFLLLHGSADKLADPKGSEMLYNNAKSNDKEFNRFKDYYHELLFEQGREQVQHKIIDWLNHRVK